MTTTVIEKQPEKVINNNLINLINSIIDKTPGLLTPHLGDPDKYYTPSEGVRSYILKKHVAKINEIREEYYAEPKDSLKGLNFYGTKINQNDVSCCAFVRGIADASFTLDIIRTLPLQFYKDYSDMLENFNMPYVYLSEEQPNSKYARFIIETSVLNADTEKIIQFEDKYSFLNLLAVQMLRLLFNSSFYNVGELLLHNYKKYKEELTPSEIILTTLLPIINISTFHSTTYNNTYSPILAIYGTINPNIKHSRLVNYAYLQLLSKNFKDITDTDKLYAPIDTINAAFHDINLSFSTGKSQASALLFYTLFVATDNFNNPIEAMDLVYKYNKIMLKIKTANTEYASQLIVRIQKILTDRNYLEIITILNEND